MTGEQERLLVIRAQGLVDVVAEQESMVQNGNPSIRDRRYRAIDVDQAVNRLLVCHAGLLQRNSCGGRDARARSQKRRCFSALEIRCGSSIGGSNPK